MALPRKLITCHSYHNLDNEAFENDILESELVQNPSEFLDELCIQYDKVLSSVNDKHCPLKTRNITIRPHTPWYSNEINEAQKLRRKYESKWRETSLTVHREMYIEQKTAVADLIKKAKN